MPWTARSARLLALLAALCLGLVACAGGETAETDADGEVAAGDEGDDPAVDDDAGEEQPAGEIPRFVSIATGGTGGAYYPIGGAMGAMLAREVDGIENGTAETTGGSVENLQLLGDQRTEIAFSMNDAVYDAINGENDFDEPLPIRSIGQVYLNVLQVVTTQDRGIESFADMAGQRVSVGDAGSATELMLRNVLDVLGMSYDDFGETQRLPFADQTTAIRNNQLDVGSWVVAPGVSSIHDLASSEQIHVIPLSDEELDQITEAYPYYIAHELEAGTYQGQDEAVSVAATWNALLMHADADREFVYQVTRAIHEHVDDLASGHPSGGDLSADNIAESVAPLHPGAIDYFLEVGVDIPDALYPDDYEERG
jgi:uncharacterized protein